MLQVAGNFSTPIPDVWELEGYEFITICTIMAEDVRKANGQSTGPIMKTESVEMFGKLLESMNGR